jgi:glycosyltransferase involved in cell wall biosynthesis
MRILVLHGYGLSGSGSAIYTRDLIRALAGSGFDVDLVCHEADLAAALPRALHVAMQPGVTRCSQRIGTSTVRVYALADRAVPVMYTRPELPRGREIGEWSGDDLDRYADGVFAFLQQSAPPNGWDAMLVNHMAGLCSVAARWSEREGTPWSAIVHGTGLLYGMPHAALRDRVVEALRSCTSVVVLNQEVRARTEAAFGDHCPPLCEVPPGVDTARFRRRTSAATGRVAYAGRLTLDKGVHHLLLAWPRVLERCPNAKLHLAGAGGDAETLRAAFDDLCRGDGAAAGRRLAALGRGTGRAGLVWPAGHSNSTRPRGCAFASP